MLSVFRQRPALLLLAGWFCTAWLLVGCGGKWRLVPVKGRITVNGKPAAGGGTVTLAPDASKGNQNKVFPSGKINEDGTYELFTEGKSGAPVGAYLVTVQPYIPLPGDRSAKAANTYTPGREGETIGSKYSDPVRSGLTLEVTDHPGPQQYDLPLTK